jgi:uncharacterized protein YjhX (UPF0386 family)
VDPKSGQVYAGIIDPVNRRRWKLRRNITDTFVANVIVRFLGHKQVVQAQDGTEYEISVRKINTARADDNQTSKS